MTANRVTCVKKPEPEVAKGRNNELQLGKCTVLCGAAGSHVRQPTRNISASPYPISFVKGGIVPCRFCGGPDNDGHLFWECPHPPFVHTRESIEFRDLLLRDRSSWPRCLLWHGWLPSLACTGGAPPWAASADDIACARPERLLGSYSEGECREWVPPDHFVDSVASSDVSDHPDVWTDGSFVLDELSGVGLVGVGFTL